MLVLILTLCTWFSGAEGSGPIRRSGDLDRDGRSEEYLLEDKVLTVKEAGQCLWQSPREWNVDSFVLGDADNDGSTDLVISLWKTGSFGPSRPFWHQSEDESFKNHLFVLKMQENNFKSLWCSSNLDAPIVSFEVKDVNNDGFNELVVREGKYRRLFGEKYALDARASVTTTVWQWDQWGFSLKK